MVFDDVDVRALGEIRPGDQKTKLIGALGARWREPLPFREGLVDVVANSHHFEARLTRDGTVGSVRFGWGFAREVPLSGLYIGMSLEAARAARPDLEIGEPLQFASHLRFANFSERQGLQGMANFNSERLVKVEFLDRAAEYPPKQPVPYPPATGVPGAPFADPNLKLVVLSKLLYDKTIDLGEPTDLAEHVLGRAVDLEVEGYGLIPEARDYLACYPLTSELLAAPKELVFDGSGSVYPFAFYFWGGETEDFDVRTLEGIENLVNCEKISISSMLEAVDLAPLLEMPALKQVSGYSDWGASDVLKARNAQTIEHLERRGVKFEH